ncbi:MAG TPA: 3-oxoacyl-[acyl-carrier-protein] synthase III C-terminal domain-containing protein [Verrucomicrobiae bacterium]|jgi:3-oxoacyl-[acyl-carrier-protein] synthase-3|nr:3-oxoacyl-[acyl-carrier-protein] synthase III C-terminal domain-containing protein [Verrucomicrobiae bacterium]
MAPIADEDRWQRLIEECFQREAGSQASLPSSSQNLIETGVLDSMGWVGFLRALESASGVSDLGALLTEQTPSFESIFRAFKNARSVRSSGTGPSSKQEPVTQSAVIIASSSAALGSRRIPSEQVDRAFGMPAGKLRLRAGIESLAYAAEDENELTLGAGAAQRALRAAACGPEELDWIIATTETQRGYPSLAAQLHSQLLPRENCGALDVGGACLGLVNALAVAQGLIALGQARTIAVITSDVHSRTFKPGVVAGEFGGLFGDGASAFLLRAKNGVAPQPTYGLGEFFFGCAGQYAGAIRVADVPNGNIEVHFDGEALSRAAITRLENVIRDIELRSGIARSSLQGLATHQPNPRLVTLLAKQCGLPLGKFPVVARQFGNLGSSTCGVALDAILQSTSSRQADKCGPIFMASLGPGLLFGGGWLVPA